MVADLRDQGKSVDEVKAWVLENRLTINQWFFSADLTHYFRRGRISRSSAFFGNMLHICPLMAMNPEGKLIPRNKVRGKSKVTKRLINIMEESAIKGKAYDGYCYLATSDDFRTANKVKDEIEAYFHKLKGKVIINSIGAVIGCIQGQERQHFFFQRHKR